MGMDIENEDTLRPSILKSIGGKYIDGRKVKAENIDDVCGESDYIFEATGAAQLQFQLIDALGINGVYALTGIPSPDRIVNISGGSLIEQVVLKNQIILGSVNASFDHYKYAVDDLVEINKKWPAQISKMITDKFHYTDFKSAFAKHSSDEIKTVIEWKEI